MRIPRAHHIGLDPRNARVEPDLDRPVAAARPDRVLEGRFTDADLMRYSLVPFDVPPGHHQLHLRYSYSE
ncbi:MAG TPA: hypothetical protein VE640_06740, partial [Candidatus Bathyarchaeia archaeon]|nr:hypothetical protein [Candidatus Bathyarchaeia archaeon]